jgi:hypothetical protein
LIVVANLANILIGMTANCLWATLFASGKAGLTKIQSALSGDETLRKLYTQAAQEALAHITGDETSRSKLSSFLRAPEAEGCVRQFYASRAVFRLERPETVASIQREFSLALSRHLDADSPAVLKAADTLFGYIIRGCDRLLSLTSDQGWLGGHERLSSARHHLLLDELQNIASAVKQLSIVQPRVADIVQFEQAYRGQVAARHSYITPPHLDIAKKIPIDELYTKPTLTVVGHRGAQEYLPFDDLLARAYRLVLLGQPGGGKSTFAAKVCHDLSVRADSRLIGGRELTPILVVLREYGARKREAQCSITTFIQEQALSRYQLPVPPGAFDYLLSVGRVVVIFDGLDELIDTSYRREISDDVESFCALYPSIPVIVTSRVVGYEEAPLSEDRFEVYTLAPFDDNQVLEYATKWFSRDHDAPAASRTAKANAFFHESKSVPDLRSNPLMLGLMCTLYYVEGYIPRNRPELYEKCSVMLFERWDKGRGIVLKLSFDEHIRPALQYLAHWIYSTPALQSGVTQNELVSVTTNFLAKWVFDRPARAELAAQEFIDFCRGRAWVFTDTGTTADGERLYQFTHRTFLEYFAAVYLVSTNPTPTGLAAALLPHIIRREWDVVALLSCQILSRRVQGGADDLLRAWLFDESGQFRSADWNVLLFCARALDVIVPTPGYRRFVVVACLRSALARSGDRQRGTSGGADDVSCGDLVGHLLGAHADNLDAILSAIEDELVATINHGEAWAAVLALELLFHLRLALLHASAYAGSKRGALERCLELSRLVFGQCQQRVVALAKRHLTVAVDALRRDMISYSEFVAHHGIEGLFAPIRLEMFAVDRLPQVFWEMDQVIRPSAEGVQIVDRRRIAALAQALLQKDPPWTDARDWISGKRRYGFLWFASRVAKLRELRGDTAFVSIVLLAILLHLENSEQLGRSLNMVKAARSVSIESIRWILITRFRGGDEERANAQMEALGLRPHERALVSAWMKYRVSFVRMTAVSKRTVFPPLRNGTLGASDKGVAESSVEDTWLEEEIDR